MTQVALIDFTRLDRVVLEDLHAFLDSMPGLKYVYFMSTSSIQFGGEGAPNDDVKSTVPGQEALPGRWYNLFALFWARGTKGKWSRCR